jgi:iron complex transport system substrate-binding protein
MSPAHLPNRIVCLQPSATVILAGLGELDRVVACTKYCVEVVPKVKTGERLIVADSWSAKAGEIVAAKPDLVIAAVPYRPEALAEILKAGVRFVALAPQTLKDIYTDIATIAGLVAASGQGEKMILQMQAEIERVRRATASFPRKRVFCEEWGKPIITSQFWVEELVWAAGGAFVSKPGSRISAEEVAKLDPEVIVAAWCGAGDRVPLEKVIRQRVWENTIAAKTGQVYCVSDELLNTPAPTLVAGLHALTAAIHPTALRSLQPLSVANANQKEPRRITEVFSSTLIRKELV